MIAIDTSALIAIIQREPDAGRCVAALKHEDRIVMSAAILAEALIVSSRRNFAGEMTTLIDGLAIDIISVTASSAQRIAKIYRRWGKGVHPAKLNFADCFAYDVAKEHGCRLLYVGQDFAKTDIAGVD